MNDKHLASQIFNKYISKSLNKKKTFILGIDGPTASGKTILADNIKKFVTNFGMKCFIFRLDWLLTDRKKRVIDLTHLKDKSGILEYESVHHMRLEIAEEFLKKIRCLEYNKKSKTISLDKLYNRNDNGKINGKEKFRFDRNTLFILEGHYTSEIRIGRYIDLNVLLLGDSKELIKRKVDRVKDYRNSAETIDYYQRIDLPSFKNHLKNHGHNANLIIDNTKVNNPKFKDKSFIFKWIENNISSIKPAQDTSKFKNLLNNIFSSSLSSLTTKKIVSDCIIEILEWEKKISEYLTISIDQINYDLTSYANYIFKKLNSKNKSKAFIEVIHTNAIHNVYKRKLPVTLGVNIDLTKEKKNIKILIEIANKFLNLRIVWDGGSKKIQLKRELGKINDYEIEKFELIKEKINEEKFNNSKFKVYTPAPFLIPSFLRNFQFEVVVTDHEEENLSTIECLDSLINNPGVLIRRFATFKELFFFKQIFLRLGFECLDICNYLIAIKSNNINLSEKFRHFSSNWDSSFLRDANNKKCNDYDDIVFSERSKVKFMINNSCKDFVYLDESLYCKKNIQSNNFTKLKKQITKMLSSENRLMRKKICQFLLERFPGLKVNVADYWNDQSIKQKKIVNFSEILEIQPSILAEIYLWMNIRGDSSAILGANIYDIVDSSIDCYSYLSSSFKNKTPVVLQVSLNASGQKEKVNGKINHGYLKPKKGVRDFINSATNAARDYFLNTGNTSFLYGLGLDHVNYENDKPAGRANRFLNESINSELITHFVLDGSAKFKIKNTKINSFRKAFTPVIDYALSLLDNIPVHKHYIFDKEICAGELNYSENQKKAILPTAESFAVFVEVFQKGVLKKYLLPIINRPLLFIGNLGTTHHGDDRSSPKVELAQSWKERIQRFNFISAVLHGTTRTHSDYLRKSTNGCHKVNVAGDFLETFKNNVPAELFEILIKNNKEIKKNMYLVSPLLKKIGVVEKKKLSEALESHCNKLQTNINSPKLQPNDISYFKYRPYKFDKYQIQEIIKSIQQELKSKKNTSQKIHKKSKVLFSASMIEVPFDAKYKKIVKAIYRKGVRNFHIDVGDGEFISREIDATDKVLYLNKNFKDIKIHCHLMVKNPHNFDSKNISTIQKYINAGCHAIALHERAFDNSYEFEKAINLIKRKNVRPGLIIETHQMIDENLLNLLKKHNIQWVVIMGVVVGFGGQIFDNKIILKIRNLCSYYSKINKKILIEIDGGLNDDNIKLCIDAGADILSGWSIVKAPEIKTILKKLENIKLICEK